MDVKKVAMVQLFTSIKSFTPYAPLTQMTLNTSISANIVCSMNSTGHWRKRVWVGSPLAHFILGLNSIAPMLAFVPHNLTIVTNAKSTMRKLLEHGR